ncbi:MAG: sugar phosphate nucleotidyltransferase [Verrucomicrobiota bacterium]|nr:sugar phosphate nucleotidyltransferase [Limisphaera sp.]MDW8381837.1 sugar phosphate nucleotidyltransferase [Verrucomicrobiota bacterium]
MGSREDAVRYVVLMAGGRGERFWPLSRRRMPKHLLPLWEGHSLLQRTVERVEPLVPISQILVVTTAEQARIVRRQLPFLPRENLIVEPAGRDTAPAVTLSAAIVGARSSNAVMAMLPADHWIGDTERFRNTLADALDLAAQHPVIVTLGICPTEPATGYGYIRLGNPWSYPRLPGHRGTLFHHADAFIEKPCRERALEFVQSGQYRWNAGMFVWHWATFRDGLAEHRPDFHAALLRWIQFSHQPARLRRMLAREYPTLPRVSIDYALMERARNIVVGDASFDWDDLGSWTSLARHLPQDPAGNVLHGDCLTIEASGNVVYDARSTPRRTLMALLGVQDLILVQTDDAVLLVHKSQAQKVRDLVQRLAQHPRQQRLV